MKDLIPTSSIYDSDYIEHQQRMYEYEGAYNLSKLNVTPFKEVTYCHKANQLTGGMNCSNDAYYARNPEEIKELSQYTVAKKGPSTHYLTYDDVAQNREQEKRHWFMKPPGYWRSAPQVNVDVRIGVNSTLEAKDNYKAELNKYKR
jgi:hypothetical protein